MPGHVSRPPAIKVIAAVNAAGAILTPAFWGLVFLRLFAAGTPPGGFDAGSLSSTFGFMVGDLVWAEAALIASVVGLLRMRMWGWLSAQIVNALWLYSMTVIWCRDIHGGGISPGALLFLPFVPFSVWALFHLWRVRGDFGSGV